MGSQTAAPRQTGFTLLEILITVVILSLGLLGMAALQASSMRGTQTAYLRSQAVAMGHQIADAMRANRDQAISGGNYATQFNDGVDSLNCGSSSNVARDDLCIWKTALESRLPDGSGSVNVAAASGKATICIRWSQPQRLQETAPDSDNCGKVPDDKRQFEFETVL